MTNFELLYLLTTVAAVVISCTALVRTRHFNKVAADLAAKQLELIGRAERTGDWLFQEGRFKALNRNVEGLWSHKVGSAATKWQVFPAQQKASPRDVQSFEAEVVLADASLRKLLDIDASQFKNTFGPTPLDRWLNTVTALGVHPQSDMQLSSTNEGVQGEGGMAEDLAGMSAVACALLAGGVRPSSPRKPA